MQTPPNKDTTSVPENATTTKDTVSATENVATTKDTASVSENMTPKDTVSVTENVATTKGTDSVSENVTPKDTVSVTENVATTKDSDNEFIVPPPPTGFPNYESMAVSKSVWSSSHGVQSLMTRFLPDDKQWEIKNLFMSIIDNSRSTTPKV